MTHEELLQEINERLGKCDCLSCNYEYAGFIALRAVVELHKPVKDEWIDYVTCAACRVGDDDYYSPKYPCGTIEIIEKELK